MEREGKSTSKSIFSQLFKRYYKSSYLELPQDLPLREIALQPIDGDYYIRHLVFETEKQLLDYITEAHIPKHLYYSSAKYRDPGNQVMSEKGWLGSDLVFDIDANEIPQCIDKVIEAKFCKSCNYTVPRESSEKTCPLCGGQLEKFEHVEPDCIKLTFEYLRNLVDIVENDFGFYKYKASFSGNRGFHLIVELNSPYDTMDSESRRELVSYIVLGDAYKKIVKNMYVTSESKKGLVYPLPRIGDGGIRRRIARALLKKVTDVRLKEFLLNRLDEIESNKLVQLASILTSDIDEVLNEISIPIDSKVTIDTSHLVRIPNSLNGKTGWKAFLIKDLSNFELSNYEVSIEDVSEFFKIKIIVDIPTITIIDRTFKVRRGDIMELEYAYASYFVFKGVAELLSIVR
jgi:DNA primase small subunit